MHQFKPRFSERRVLEDPEMLEAFTNLNHEIAAFAEVLNAPTVPSAVHVTTTPADIPIGAMLKRRGATTHLFAVNTRPTPVRAAFELSDVRGTRARVHGESRTIPIVSRRFEDAFEPYAVHIYLID